MARIALSRIGLVALGISGLSIPALCAAIVVEVVAGPFDKCPSSIYTSAQNFALGTFIGTAAVLVLGLLVAAIGKANRRDAIGLAVEYAIALSLLVVAILLYASHPAFECP